MPGQRLVAGVEFVQGPAQSIDDPGAFGDEMIAVVAQQSDIPCRAVELRGRQVALAQRSPCDGQCVDRVGLAIASGRVADVGISLVGTPTIRSPAPSRSRSSRRDRCRQSSIAQSRSSPNCSAQLSSATWSLLVVPVVCWPTLRRCRRQQWRCGCACVRRRPQSPWVVSPFMDGVIRPARRAPLSRGDATLLSSHAGSVGQHHRPQKGTRPDFGKTWWSEPMMPS